MKRAAFFMVFVVFVACLALQAMLEQEAHAASDSDTIDVIARTTISGTVNDSAIKGTVLASFNTGLGGSSSCTFSSLPGGFTPATLATHAWTSHHTSAGLSRIGNDVLNLFDLTGGKYRLQRTIFYPEFPFSQIVTDAQVTSEWVTNITINGTYNGPTDIVSTEDYQLVWTASGEKVIEFGTSILRLSSGGSVRQNWISTIIPEKGSEGSPESGRREKGFEGFPKSGELLRVSISPFQIEGKEMRYEWKGTVEHLLKQQKNGRD